MPLLAEPKNKVRLCANPRGLLWANDESKFGQKLLEKMGWSKGKGLGKKEQGCKDILKVNHKSNLKGVGYEDNEEDWMNNHSAYEDVLSNLVNINNPECDYDASSTADEQDGKRLPLEHRSKNSKSRVHYKKFTQGKDLSLCTEDDLACILGSKRPFKRDKKDKGQGEYENNNEVSGDLDKSYVFRSIYGGSLEDYFNQKMEELKKKREGGILGGPAPPSPLAEQNEVETTAPPTDLEFEPANTEDLSFKISLQELGEELAQEDKSVSERRRQGIKKRKKHQYQEEILNDEVCETKKESKKCKEKHNAETEVSWKENQTIESENPNRKKRKGEKKIEENEICQKLNNKKVNEENKNQTKERENLTESEIVTKEKTKKKKICSSESFRVFHLEKKNKKAKKKSKSKAFLPNKEENVSPSKENKKKDGNAMKLSNMNDSYISATSIVEKIKKKKKKGRKDLDSEEAEEEEEERKIPNVAHEVTSGPKLLREDVGAEESSYLATGLPREQELFHNAEQPRTQLKRQEKNDGTLTKSTFSKTSFKELKAELGSRLKHKTIKNSLDYPITETIKGSLTLPEERDGGLITLKIKKPKHCNSGFNFNPLDPKILTVNTNDLFPGSNMSCIKGYDSY